MTSALRHTVAFAIGGLLLIGCNGEEPPGETATGETTLDEGAEDVDGTEEASSAEATDDEGEASEDTEADTEQAGPAGTLTLDGVTVELQEAYWCEDHESNAGRTDMRLVGIVDDMLTLDAGAFTTDDGTDLDVVTIWEIEEFDRGVGGTQVVGVEEGEDGYPWIEIDGRDVTIDGSFRGEDDPDDVEAAVFSAEFTIEQEPRGSAHC